MHFHICQSEKWEALRSQNKPFSAYKLISVYIPSGKSLDFLFLKENDVWQTRCNLLNIYES
jgi:hypothetical protein